MSEQQNPLLARLRIPGETFRMPSQGVFYINGELAEGVKNGEVEVHPLTAHDEIILSTPDKLLSGKAVVEIFQNCIPQILRPMDLLAKDVDYLMVCLRMVTFGQFMEVSYRHICEGALFHTYNIDMQRMIRESKAVDPTTINSEHLLQLPNGQQVNLRPLTYGKVLELHQTTMMMKMDEMTQAEAEALIVNTIASVVGDVDGVSDPQLVREWVMNIPLGWKRQIEAAAQNISEWGVNVTSQHTCEDCKKPMDVMISINPVSFFT